MFELAMRRGREPVSIAEIAEAQAIPPRFLEQIFGQLRQAGFVESRRGMQGGYMLRVSPRALTVGEVIRFFEGPLAPVHLAAAQGAEAGAVSGDCAFGGLWEKAQRALAEVYDSTTFQDLVDEERAAAGRFVANWSI
jgi:Rrf2 family protein